MSIKVEVKSKSTSKTILIADLDTMLCQDFGWPIHEKFAQGYDLVCNLAIVIMMQFGGGCVTKQTFNKYLKIANPESLIRNVDESKLRKWLYEDYTWDAWR